MSHTASMASSIASVALTLLALIGVIYYCLTKSEEPGKLLFQFILTFLLIAAGIYTLLKFPRPWWPPIAALFGLALAITWARTIGALVARPFEAMFTGGSEPPTPTPLYSIAESKRNLGLFADAIRLIRAEMEKFPGDFTGMMLMASIQAENQNDIQAAATTIEHLLADKTRPPQAAATALHALADWHLRLEDPDSARLALERIIKTYPDTPVAQIAAQRIARLTSKTEMSAMRRRGPIALPVGEKNLGLRTDVKAPEEADPTQLAAEYVRQLEKHPLDTDTREKLALLYLNHYQRPDLALNQLEQLAAQPAESPRRIARWLNLLADVHVRRKDLAAATQALQRIIQAYPETAAAQLARERLAGLEAELKPKPTGAAIKLGTYQRELGLKKPPE